MGEGDSDLREGDRLRKRAEEERIFDSANFAARHPNRVPTRQNNNRNDRTTVRRSTTERQNNNRNDRTTAPLNNRKPKRRKQRPAISKRVKLVHTPEREESLIRIRAREPEVRRRRAREANRARIHDLTPSRRRRRRERRRSTTPALPSPVL